MKKKEAEKRFENQIKGHELLIHKVCRMYAQGSAERKDLFQDIVVQLWTSFSRFKGNSKFSTWLYRVAINTAITGMGKRKDFIDYYEPGFLPQRVDVSTAI